MKIARLVAALLLALPLILFGTNYFLEFFAVEQPATAGGLELLEALREGGLMGPIALSHVVIGLMLIVQPVRFVGALLQLPMSLGILAFHVTMMPEGNGFAAVMLALNLVVLADPKRLRALFTTS